MSALPDLKTREAIQGYLKGVGTEMGVSLSDPQLAAELDKRDKLSEFRDKFHVPTISDYLEGEEIAEGVDVSQPIVYMVGNSLGLQPKGAKECVDREMEKWARRAFQGHNSGRFPWYPIEDFLVGESARIVGARPIEVAVMNTLSVNIHLGLAAFYQPTKERWKILMEERAFPSDHYAVESQVHWHGYDPKSTIILVPPRKGGNTWRNEDILEIIQQQGDTIALVYFSGIHYASGHLFDMKSITEAAHKKGCYAGFDLAHAAGNVELHLHDWGVDFACWCTYKYLCAGPGGIAGFFVHERHAHNTDLPKLLGWWGHKRATRFVMDNVLELQPGAAGFQLSNPPVLQCVLLRSSLDVFALTSMADIGAKSRLLTGYLELLLEENLGKGKTSSQDGHYVEVVTSRDPMERGAQLSLQFSRPIKEVYSYLSKHGGVCDLREPNMMRVAPAPLYNSFMDVVRYFNLLKQALGRD